MYIRQDPDGESSPAVACTYLCWGRGEIAFRGHGVGVPLGWKGCDWGGGHPRLKSRFRGNRNTTESALYYKRLKCTPLITIRLNTALCKSCIKRCSRLLKKLQKCASPAPNVFVLNFQNSLEFFTGNLHLLLQLCRAVGVGSSKSDS